MKNVISLGLIACATFVNVVHAEAEHRDANAEYLANMICGDGAGPIRNARWEALEGKHIERKQAEVLGLTSHEYYEISNYVLGIADKQFKEGCKANYAKNGLVFGKEWSEKELDKSDEIQQFLAKNATAFYTTAAKAIDENVKEKAATKVGKIYKYVEPVQEPVEQETPKQKEIPQVGSKAAQVDCSDFESNAFQLSEMMKMRWSTYMDMRKDLRNSYQGLYDQHTLNNLINEKTADLKREAEMASNEYQSYSNQCKPLGN